jgi:SAM-dependent methyltransferase
MTDSLWTIDEALRNGTCLLLVLSEPGRVDRQSQAGGSFLASPASQLDLRKISVHPVVVRGRALLQIERRFATNVVHENVELEQAVALVHELFPSRFQQAALFTPNADYTLRAKRDGGVAESSGPATRTLVEAGHNRDKAYLISDGVACPFLVEIGVMTSGGQVRAAKYHKFRQINRYLELVNDVVASLPKDQPLRVVDFGCGKSYLTFALHHLLTSIHGREATIVGIDRRKDVAQDCSRIAEKLGCAGLTFRVGDIESHTEAEHVDLAVSLHACDTATDAALAKAIRWGCDVILAVPCCHHELARQVESAALAPLLLHGILQQRFAASVTDALRARVLDLCGYTTQVVEFIDLEHTPQNILLRGVRRRGVDPHRDAKLDEYTQLKQLLNVREFALERLLCDEGIAFP